MSRQLRRRPRLEPLTTAEEAEAARILVRYGAAEPLTDDELVAARAWILDKAPYPFDWRTQGTVLVRLLATLDAARESEALAIAHDRQPYPTAWAYEQACRARDKWQAKAERMGTLKEPPNNAKVWDSVPTDDCPCGHDDTEHVHYCSHELTTGSCPCNEEYIRSTGSA